MASTVPFAILVHNPFGRNTYESGSLSPLAMPAQEWRLVLTAQSFIPALATPPQASQPAGSSGIFGAAAAAAWNIEAAPSGKGLPSGSGTAAQGARIYADKCAGCHKPDLTGGGAPGAGRLVGGAPLTNGMGTETTIANFYANSTTLFDYVRRAMPIQAPRTLTNDEVYALTAFILAANKIIPDEQVMNARTLPKVRMPSADIFIIRFPGLI